MVQGQVFLKRGAGTFPIKFFKTYHFYIQKLLCPLQNCVMHFEEKKFFCHHSFMKKGQSKLSKNEPENIP